MQRKLDQLLHFLSRMSGQVAPFAMPVLATSLIRSQKRRLKGVGVTQALVERMSPVASTGGFATAGLGIGCVETSQHAAVATLAPTELRGSAFGLLAAVRSFGNMLASTIVGVLWSAFSPTAAFLYLAIGAVVALLVLIRRMLCSPSPTAHR
jgi:hypothetical protein